MRVGKREEEAIFEMISFVEALTEMSHTLNNWRPRARAASEDSAGNGVHLTCGFSNCTSKFGFRVS